LAANPCDRVKQPIVLQRVEGANPATGHEKDSGSDQQLSKLWVATISRPISTFTGPGMRATVWNSAPGMMPQAVVGPITVDQVQ
jgi:hypothetical protein